MYVVDIYMYYQLAYIMEHLFLIDYWVINRIINHNGCDQVAYLDIVYLCCLASKQIYFVL